MNKKKLIILSVCVLSVLLILSIVILSSGDNKNSDSTSGEMVNSEATGLDADVIVPADINTNSITEDVVADAPNTTEQPTENDDAIEDEQQVVNSVDSSNSNNANANTTTEENIHQEQISTTQQQSDTPEENNADITTENISSTDNSNTSEVVAYSPYNVTALAIAKCEAGGMITTQTNLDNALAEGRITQEEYEECYPYDGLEGSYYSVFVETDLNTASTISGEPLRSEDAIATYIANMLLLESNPVFNVVYAGVYNMNGTDFYEFRCLR